MADIQMRFHKDMLVLSAPLDATLAAQGVAVEFDRQYLNLVEQDSLEDAFRLEMIAGAQCLVTTTADITAARLAHARMEGDATKLATAALETVRSLQPQHILVEIGPCGLPLDASSKQSLNENRDQYSGAARLFNNSDFDAFFLNGFTSIDDLKCALMGVKQVSDKPVFVSMYVGSASDIDANKNNQSTSQVSSFSIEDINSGLPSDGYSILDNPLDPLSALQNTTPLAPELWPQALETMIDLGAAVVGFETAEPIDKALDYVKQATEMTSLPLLVSLRVVKDPLNAKALGLTPIEELQEYTPDTLVFAGQRLRDAGVQFLRATGDATASCTGALVASVSGEDAIR